MRIEMEPIASFKSCFLEKFGTPRQAGLAPHAHGVIQFLPPYNDPQMIEGIDQFSHLWITFLFHQNRWSGAPMVRPQRLGGNRKMGVFATRSSFRPNGMGLSAVKIEGVDRERMEIEVSGHDFVEGTPILCIKPYIPFSDAIVEARSSFAPAPPERVRVDFTEKVREKIEAVAEEAPTLHTLIEEVIAQNPAPPFHQEIGRLYGVRLLSWNIRFERTESGFRVIDIESLKA